MHLTKLLIVVIVVILGYFFYDKFSYLIQIQDQEIELLYALLLLGFLSFVFLSKKFSKKVFFQNLAIWILIFSCLIIGYSYRFELEKIYYKARSSIFPSYPLTVSKGEVQVNKDMNGHYQVIGFINHKKVKFLVDTGASAVTLTYKDASRVGINIAKLNYNIVISTANGFSKVAYIELKELRIGDITINNVKAFVAKEGLSTSLLGMTFLNRLKSFHFKNNTLIFTY